MMSKLYLLVAIVCVAVGYAIGISADSSSEMVEVFPKYKVYVDAEHRSERSSATKHPTESSSDEYSEGVGFATEEALTCPDGSKPIHVMVGEDPNTFYITCREQRLLE